LGAGSGAVAQMGERCNRTAEVRGSNPLSSTKTRLMVSGADTRAIKVPSGRPVSILLTL
jgi:hypothetical protein